MTNEIENEESGSQQPQSTQASKLTTIKGASSETAEDLIESQKEAQNKPAVTNENRFQADGSLSSEN